MTTRVDRTPWIWLLSGAVLLVASQLRAGMGVLAWVAPVPFLHYLRITRGWWSRTAFVLVSAAAWFVAVLGIMTDPLPRLAAAGWAVPFGVFLVAKAMAMSERTLQRRLEEHELSYSDVLADLRQELGRQYLREPDVSIAEVAFLLGFSDQSALGRAFKRWTGETPRAWRRAHAGRLMS